MNFKKNINVPIENRDEFNEKIKDNCLFGDWGLGIGDWGLGIGPNPQSPIPNPQSPSP